MDYIKKAERIRARYEDKEDSDYDKLARLDRKVRRPAEAVTYTIGVAATLLLGVGMCLSMKVIGNIAPVGIAIGAVGIILLSINALIYKLIFNRRRKKFHEQIAELSDAVTGSIQSEGVQEQQIIIDND